LTDLAWSPDGGTVVSSVAQPGDVLSGLVAIDVQSGKRNLFAISPNLYLHRPEWLPDGSGLLVLADNAYGSQTQIVFVSFPSGKISPVTRDTNSYADLSLSADGHTAATVLRQAHLNAYVVPDGAGSSQARQLTMASLGDSISWTRDGQLLISGTTGGVTLLNPESGAQITLLSQLALPNFARACSDGHILFSSSKSESNTRLHIWRADADGSNPTQLGMATLTISGSSVSTILRASNLLISSQSSSAILITRSTANSLPSSADTENPMWSSSATRGSESAKVTNEGAESVGELS